MSTDKISKNSDPLTIWIQWLHVQLLQITQVFQFTIFTHTLTYFLHLSRELMACFFLAFGTKSSCKGKRRQDERVLLARKQEETPASSPKTVVSIFELRTLCWREENSYESTQLSRTSPDRPQQKRLSKASLGFCNLIHVENVSNFQTA